MQASFKCYAYVFTLVCSFYTSVYGVAPDGSWPNCTKTGVSAQQLKRPPSTRLSFQILCLQSLASQGCEWRQTSGGSRASGLSVSLRIPSCCCQDAVSTDIPGISNELGHKQLSASSDRQKLCTSNVARKGNGNTSSSLFLNSSCNKVITEKLFQSAEEWGSSHSYLAGWPGIQTGLKSRNPKD